MFSAQDKRTSVNALFRVVSVRKIAMDDRVIEHVTLDPCEDTYNSTWSSICPGVPGGRLDLHVTNPDAMNRLLPGRRYAIDIYPVLEDEIDRPCIVKDGKISPAITPTEYRKRSSRKQTRQI